MGFKVVATIELKDKNGKLLKKFHKKLNSYVIGFLTPLWGHMNYSQPDNTFNLMAATGDDTYGIQVGTGTTAVTLADTSLETQILNGSSSGKLDYGSVSVGALVTVGSTRKFTIARTFTNNSGADITVEEVGLETAFYTTPEYFIERSLLSFTIANGTSGTVTYTISITV